MSALEPFKVMVKQEFMFSMPKTAASFCRAGHTVPFILSLNNALKFSKNVRK